MPLDARAYGRTRRACYFSYLSMSSVFSLPPLLFVTLHDMYGVSYTLLGTLVLINFSMQLLVDLLFTFFARHFNVKLCIRVMPLLTTLGMTIYALAPVLAPRCVYAGLVAGTVVFSLASGLSEVLLSPLVAALPSDDPGRDMSTLHSLYAYGVLSVVLVSTAFLQVLGRQNWMYLALFFAALPVVTFVLFCTSPLPQMDLAQPAAVGRRRRGGGTLAMCAACIFLGSAAENTMTNWISGYAESALHLPKAMGDVAGMAAFAVLLGLGRTLYARFGKNIGAVLLAGMAGAAVCYLVAGLAGPAVSLAACVLTGLCTAMLWPGTLILMEERLPAPGVAAYALMAAAGDFGASVAPQLMGAIVDAVAASGWGGRLGAAWALGAEQVGMKVGMLLAGLFPLAGTVLLIRMVCRRPAARDAAGEKGEARP